MEFVIEFQKSTAITGLSCCYEVGNQLAQTLKVRICDTGASLSESKHLKFNAESIKLMDLLGRELRNISAGVHNSSDKSLALECDQCLPNDRSAHFHLLCNLSLNDGISGFKPSGEECILERARDAIA